MIRTWQNDQVIEQVECLLWISQTCYNPQHNTEMIITRRNGPWEQNAENSAGECPPQNQSNKKQKQL